MDEKLLYDTFSAFGVILQTPKVSTLIYDHNTYTLIDYVYSFCSKLICIYIYIALDNARSGEWEL